MNAMLFRLIAVLALPALIARLSVFRFQAARASRGRAPGPFRLGPYLSWVRDRLSSLVKPDAAARSVKVVEAWLKRNYPGWRIYAWAGLVLSFGYNALSGLFFAVFISRGLWGAPLLLHVMSGGLFAFSLAAVAVLRARRYGFEAEPGGAQVECLVCPVLKKVPIVWARTAAFWIFVLAGLVLAATALASMLPYFVYTAQLEFLGIHRYAALAAVLAAIGLADLDLIPRRA
jgi:hypothetical protein